MTFPALEPRYLPPALTFGCHFITFWTHIFGRGADGAEFPNKLLCSNDSWYCGWSGSVKKQTTNLDPKTIEDWEGGGGSKWF